MPRCQTCNNFFPPKLTIVVDSGLNHHQCVFCEAEKDHVTIVDEKTGKEERLTKGHAIEEYKKYIKKIAESDRVQQLVGGGSSGSRIIKPY